MKKWFLIIGAVLLAILLGSGMVTLHGHGERNYQTCVRLGRYDVIDRNYRDALNYFQGARKVDPDNLQAKRDLDQTQSYVSGQHYFNYQRLTMAIKNYHRALKINALTALTNRARGQYQRLKSLRRSSSRFSLWYDQALLLNHRHDFKASVRRLNRITADPNLKLAYFKGFRTKVDKLMKADRKDDRSGQVTGAVKGQSEAFKLRAPKIIKDHPTRDTIAKARREIQKAGVNAREMSNGDVANLIRQAQRHRSSVARYAKKNY